MKKSGSYNKSAILKSDDLHLVQKPTRRDFFKCSAGAAGCLYLSNFNVGCGGNSARFASYPISSKVVKTTEQVLVVPAFTKISVPNSGAGLCPLELSLVSQYSKYGYGNYTYSSEGLDVVKRYDILASNYAKPKITRLKQFANFFTLTDIHITDKEAPNQVIAIQQADSTYGANMPSAYSPIMMFTTHVLDAAVQTINALHKTTPFDFGISLGDASNSAQYNETRWYIDVLDGKTITPSSGNHAGATTIDYQKPYKAAGLSSDIPWYQTLGNHDHFYIGCIPIDADPTLKIRESYISSNVWTVGNVLKPNDTFPCMYDESASLQAGAYYGGVLDGTSATGAIIDAGLVGTFNAQPTVIADKNRRALTRADWMAEFYNTTSSPSGHGFNLVDKTKGSDFACYSFVPKSNIPLKVIVLDNTQSENDGSHDIHGHGFLDQTRWTWLQKELQAGQDNHQLMIVAAHIPIAVRAVGSEMEWWEASSPLTGTKDKNATMTNACTLAELVETLQSYPNLILWAAGHRHVNTVKAFKPLTGKGAEAGFWQVETSSLRDYPQQFRTFEIYLNSDYTVSIVTTNVDPAVAEGTPAATSRKYGIATQQIIQGDILQNAANPATIYGHSVTSLDPTRAQDGSLDSTIEYGELNGVKYPSYNAELFVQLSSDMKSYMQKNFPATS